MSPPTWRPAASSNSLVILPPIFKHVFYSTARIPVPPSFVNNLGEVREMRNSENTFAVQVLSRALNGLNRPAVR